MKELWLGKCNFKVQYTICACEELLLGGGGIVRMRFSNDTLPDPVKQNINKGEI